MTWFSPWTVLLFGWGGIFFGQPAWFANVCLAVEYLLLWRDRRIPLFLPLLNAGLVLCVLLPTELAHNEGFTEYSCLKGMGTGALIWATCHILNCLLFFFIRTRAGEFGKQGIAQLETENG